MKNKKLKTSLKKKIRDTERILKNSKLPSTIRSEQERKLKALLFEHTEVQETLVEKKYAKKYRMLKFFERQKCQKKIISIKDGLIKLNDKSEDFQNLTEELGKYTNYLNYIYHYPKTQKYISLFPKIPCEDEKTNAKSLEIMETIKRRILNGEIKEAS